LGRIRKTVSTPTDPDRSYDIQSITRYRVGTIEARDRVFGPLSTAAEGSLHANKH
jgi:hypothetical protein